MGILDILKGASAKGSPDIPAGGGYTQADTKRAKEMENRLNNIEKIVKSSNKAWEKMSATRSLEKAIRSGKAWEKQQKGFEKAMKSGTISMKERIKQYAKLADSRKQAIEDTKEYNTQLNESRGMMGRLQNVLNEMPAGMSLFTAAIRDAGIVMGDMNQGFDIMARTGQIQNKTMGDLAVSTGTYMAQMRLGSIQAALFGVTAEESNAAFAKLTETYGGVGEKVDEMSEKWSGMAAMAKLSGLGMVDIANLADQGYKKLGETLDDTLNTVKDMTEITGELNARFGEGSVNSKAFASAIQEMAYGASFMNQNSRMLTETLGRELQMQLALGRAPEVALKNAQKNMEMAGKVNIVGIIQFRDQMQDAYNSLTTQAEKDEHLKNLTEEFGSEGEIIANMLKEGRLQSSDSLFAFEQAVQNSSKLRSEMLGNMRDAAASGDVGALLAVGLGIKEAQYMIEEAKLLSSKLEKLKGSEGNAQAEALFGKNWRNDPKAKRLIEDVKSGKKSEAELHRAYRRMPGKGEELAKEAAEAGKDKKEAWEVWADNNIGAAWFSGITNSFTTITGLLTSLPISLGAVIGALLLRKGLGRALGNMGMPGVGGAAGGRGLMGRGLGRMAGGMAGPGLGKLAMRTGLYGAVAAGVGLVATGMFNASEILGKADVTGIERLAAGFGNLISTLTGVDARDAAMGNTGFHKAIYAALGLNYLDGSNAGDEYASATSSEQMTAQYERRETRIAEHGGAGESMSREQYTKFMQRRGHRATRIAGGEDIEQLTSSDFMNQERVAQSSIDGNGDLILRVPDFRKEVAQANLDNLDNTG